MRTNGCYRRYRRKTKGRLLKPQALSINLPGFRIAWPLAIIDKGQRHSCGHRRLRRQGGCGEPGDLVLAGMMIGAMGALDDLVIAQASVVFELYRADPGVDFCNLYWRAMRVG